MYKPDNFDESSLNKDINEHIYGGGNVSHILNVIINQSTTDDIKYNIRKQVFDKINNVPIMFTIQNTQVVITWRSKAISNHYRADVMGIYGDTAVRLHTEMLLKILGGSKLSFMVTKPLVRTIPLLPYEVKLTPDNK